MWLQLAGLGLIVIGSWFLADDKAVHFIGIASDPGTLKIAQSAAVVMLVVGIFSLLLGLAGCWGALQQKTACLNIVSLHFYTVLLFNFFSVTLAAF